MRWRVIAVISIGVNIVLAAIWLAGPASLIHRSSPSGEDGGPIITTIGRTNYLLRRQLFSWQEVESPDYTIYIANLRNIGCPEQTIRDIIIADVNGLFARRRATELITPEQQWWRSDPDTNVLQAAIEKARGLEEERRTLLTRLLGPSWESGDLVNLPRPSRQGIVLDGPVLGTLPAETKQALEEINMRSEDRLQAYLDGQRDKGLPTDPAEIAKLRQQTRDELAKVLSPGQLEEFLLRFSRYADTLRSEFGQLKYFNPTQDEFRAVFRATDSLEQQLLTLGDNNDPNTVQARRNLEAQVADALKTALGAKRFEEFQMLHDPLYRDAVASAIAAGTPDRARLLYQVSLAAVSTQEAIRSNDALTPDQKAIELKQLEVDQLKANTLATGGELPPEPTPPPQRRTYTLRVGDTPAVIGAIYGVPESDIRAANPNVNFNRLRPGDSITIPGNALSPKLAPRTPYGP